VLINPAQLQKRVKELADEITRDYQGQRPVLIGVLRGVVCFMADLMRQIHLPLSVDFLSVSSYSSYGSGSGHHSVKIQKDLDEDIAGRPVIMIEDIVDTGMTLHYLLNYLEAHKPASIRVCTLLDRRPRRIADVPLHYVGFQIPDEFVVGYGLDWHQAYRNLPYIAVLKPKLLAEALTANK